MKNIIVLLLLITTCFACSDDDLSEFEKQQLIIEDYLVANNLQAIKTNSGLHYIINELGDGPRIMVDDSVSFDMKIRKVNEEVYFGLTFNCDSIYSFPTSSFLTALEEGLLLINEGGNITLFSPSSLAYGDRENGHEMKHQVAIFDVSCPKIKSD